MPLSSLSLSQLRHSVELFPMLTLCNCVSDAEDSGNGPRYCAQDKITKCMYEVRCVPLGQATEETGAEARQQQQQERLDALIAASQRQDLSPAVSLPIDVYVQELASTKEPFVVSVSTYTGLSLGDVIRSGWRLVEEADFEDILNCVEEYGLESLRLPPHRNLSFSALRRQLNVRPGAVEVSHRSRWVIGDWLLVGENATLATPDEVVGDLEWLLHSAFSQLNVSCDRDGTVLRKEVVELRINETIERIREGVKSGVRYISKAIQDGSQVEDNERMEGETMTEIAEEASTPNAVATTASGLFDRVTTHQQKFREEQQIVRSYRVQARGRGVPTSRRHSETSVDDVEGARRGSRFWGTLRPSVALCDISPAAERGQQALDGREDDVVTAVTEMLDASLLRDQKNHEAELDAARLHREALCTMLLRSAVISAKRSKSPLSLSRPKSHSVSGLIPEEAATVEKQRVSRSGSVDNSIIIRVSSSPATQRREPQHGRGSRVFSPPKRNGDNAVASRHDMHTASEERSFQKDSSPVRKEVPMLCLKNILENPPNGINSGRRKEQHVLSPKKTTFSGMCAVEKPPFLQAFIHGRTPRSANGRPRFLTSARAYIRSAPRRSGWKTTSPSQSVSYNKGACAPMNPHVVATPRNSGEKIDILDKSWQNKGPYRLPSRRTRSAGGATSISRSQVRPVNEASLGITMRRRQAGVCDGII
ncbi:hypothetical protein DQ04_00021240 [Trypanosoma grayi]|uniref:hypothetical protein n=1 Tax=Trypanosoma grayi TaxID=71804 RepID=UPI0004F4650F|nr:hypothetical protein DQ04_00021240 [Trypanosoma grayi]KEG15626.1 hypothetical protein DQ04_00021240 [Trypanosoma grayi]